MAAAKQALSIDPENEHKFLITCLGGVIVPEPSIDMRWTIGEYKAKKRPSGLLSLALCQQVIYDYTVKMSASTLIKQHAIRT